MLKMALTKGRIEKKTTEILKKIGYDVSSLVNKDRALQVNIGNE